MQKYGGIFSKENESSSLPVDARANTECIITNDLSETTERKNKGKFIPKNTKIHKGSVTCSESYVKTEHQEQYNHTEDKDNLLNISLSLSLVFGFLSATLNSFFQDY